MQRTNKSIHDLYRSSLISVKKLSAGIQLLPPQNTRIPLISKRNEVPSWSTRGSCTSLTWRKATLTVSEARFSSPLS
jgi:hypothetical protein